MPSPPPSSETKQTSFSAPRRHVWNSPNFYARLAPKAKLQLAGISIVLALDLLAD